MHAPTAKTDPARTARQAPLPARLPAQQPAPPAPELALHRALGNQAYGQRVQAKLTAGAPNDPHEQEADRVAGKVLHAPKQAVQRACHCGGTCAQCGEEEMLQQKPKAAPLAPLVQRQAAPEREEELDEEAEEEPIQAKLMVGLPDDFYEREADRVAEVVTARPTAPTGLFGPIPPTISPLRGSFASAQSAPEATEAAGPRAASSAENVQHALDRSRGRGHSLPSATRGFMETGFGFDFSPVRIHVGPEAQRLNLDLQARAFTSGRDIYFAAGAYQPHSHAGRLLLAHELAHVVQQAGGSAEAPPVQRKPGDCPVVDKAGFTPIHDFIEQELRPANSTRLITEAPVPGGVTEAVNPHRVGRPDLYVATPALTVCGIAKTPSVTDPTGPADYEALGAGAAQSDGTISASPTLSGGAIAGDFPAIEVADIKPLSLASAGKGALQVGNYIKGYTGFASHAASVLPGVNAPKRPAQKLTTLTIPAGLDYDQFSTESAKTPPSIPNKIVGNKRYWVAHDTNFGLLYYFCLPHPFRPGRSSSDLQAAVQALLPLKRQLRQRGSRSFGQPKRQLAQPKRRSALPRPDPAAQKQTLRRVDSSRTPAPGHVRVQRKKPAGRSGGGPVENWADKQKRWEAARKKWDEKYGLSFLKPKDGKKAKEHDAFQEFLEVNKQLGGLGKHVEAKPVTASKEAVKDLKTLELWSGKSGEQLIKLRARLGGLFDKIADFFDRMRARFSGFKKKLSKKAGKMKVGKLAGWKKKLLATLMQASKQAFGQLLDSLKNLFVVCMESVVSNVIKDFGEAVEGMEAVENVKGMVDKVEAFVKQVEEEFKTRFAAFDDLIETLSDLKTWTQIIGTLVTVGRAIWQGISCLSPPAWGCLWGLAGQFAFSAVLSLLMEVQAFRDEINKQVLKLFEDFAGEKFRRLMMWALEQVGLEGYADASACAPKQQGGSGGGLGLIPAPFTGGASTDAAVLKELRAWEKANESKLIREARDGFEKQGLVLTAEQMKELLTFLQEAGWGPDELKKHFKEAKDGEGEKPTFAEVMQRLRQAKKADANAEGEAAGEPKDAAAEEAAERAEKEAVKEGEAEDGKEKEKEATGGRVPVLDAEGSQDTSSAGTPSTDLTARVYARSGHVRGSELKVWVFIMKRSTRETLLKLKNVPVRVEHRYFYPKGTTSKTATHMEVHYKLLKRIDLSPHLDATLTGGESGLLTGYFKWPS